jgi:hypothetical protein
LSVASSVVGPARVTLVLALQRLHQPGAAQRLGIQALGGHEEQREVGGVRRRQVLVGGWCGPPAQPLLDGLAGGLGAGASARSWASSRRS